MWQTPPSSPLASSPWASSPASQVCGHLGHAGLPTAVGHCSLFYPRLSVLPPWLCSNHLRVPPNLAVCDCGGGSNVFTVRLWSKQDLWRMCTCVVHKLSICLPETLCFAATSLSRKCTYYVYCLCGASEVQQRVIEIQLSEEELELGCSASYSA